MISTCWKEAERHLQPHPIELGLKLLTRCVEAATLIPVAAFVPPVTSEGFGSEVKWERFLILTLTPEKCMKKKNNTHEKSSRSDWDGLISVGFQSFSRLC